MYRQIDPKRNESAFRREQFPKHIVELLEKMSSEEESKRQYTSKVSDIIKSKVYVYNKKSKKMKTARVHLARSYDIATALESAYETLGVSEIAPISRCRLVLFDPSDDELIESLDGEHNKDRTIGSIDDNSPVSPNFLLETRDEKEAFVAYKREEVQLKVFKVDLDTKDINGPYFIRTLGEDNMKQAIAKTFNIDAGKVLTYYRCCKTNAKVFISESKEEINEDAESDIVDNYTSFVVDNFTGMTYFYITHPSTDSKSLNILGELVSFL